MAGAVRGTAGAAVDRARSRDRRAGRPGGPVAEALRAGLTWVNDGATSWPGREPHAMSSRMRIVRPAVLLVVGALLAGAGLACSQKSSSVGSGDDAGDGGSGSGDSSIGQVLGGD